MNSINNRISSKEAADFSFKQENHHDKTKKASPSSTTITTSNNLTASSQWLRSKDTRIVRVSRAFGGKDRHSKVCTVKGLRDRRVRLSVSTAIQLYDLQDRLGFNQPSKVVDWLLDIAKHEIDELPPLQIPTGCFSSFCHQPVTSLNNQVTSSSQQNEQGLNIMEGSNSIMSKSKGEVAIDKEKANWNRREEEEEDNENMLTRGNNHHHPSFLGLLNTMPPLGYNVNNNQWEGANSSDISHTGNLGFSNQQTGLNSNNTDVVPFSGLSSTLSLSTGPYFPSHFGAIMDMDPSSRQMNQYQMLMSSSNSSLMNPSVVNHNTTSQQQQPTKPFSFTMMMTPKLLRAPNSSETQCRDYKDHQVFPSK